MIEIAAAALLVVCITATSAADAAGRPARSADGLSCGFSAAQNASPAARCAAIKRQCGGKFFANACGEQAALGSELSGRATRFHARSGHRGDTDFQAFTEPLQTQLSPVGRAHFSAPTHFIPKPFSTGR
ncbi:hypothetical protein [Bradyrhizobium sp. BR 1433]|uniref:hypothetical protein n=1 Tax=Bradyrhizobium sp. BR 1433 TaxID=3447967 RepID=UPI003EE78ECA